MVEQLKERGKFTESPDNKTLLAEFIRNNNPVISFVDDKEFKKCSSSYSREAIYKDYQSWCKDNGYMGKNREQFLRILEQSCNSKILNSENSEERGKYDRFKRPLRPVKR